MATRQNTAIVSDLEKKNCQDFSCQEGYHNHDASLHSDEPDDDEEDSNDKDEYFTKIFNFF